MAHLLKDSSPSENPFDDTPSTVNPSDLSGMVRRIAEIEDELDRRGADPLIKEKEELRKVLKQQMIAENRDEVFDEVSEFVATITDRSSDVWDIEGFDSILTPAQYARYIKRTVDENAVKEGIKNGDLSRPVLERAGVVEKKVGAKALYVRKKKMEE